MASNGAQSVDTSASVAATATRRQEVSPAVESSPVKQAEGSPSAKQATQPSPAQPAPPQFAAAAAQVSEPLTAVRPDRVVGASQQPQQLSPAAVQNGASRISGPPAARSSDPKPVFPVPLTVEEEVDQVRGFP